MSSDSGNGQNPSASQPNYWSATPNPTSENLANPYSSNSNPQYYAESNNQAVIPSNQANIPAQNPVAQTNGFYQQPVGGGVR